MPDNRQANLQGRPDLAYARPIALAPRAHRLVAVNTLKAPGAALGAPPVPAVAPVLPTRVTGAVGVLGIITTDDITPDPGTVPFSLQAGQQLQVAPNNAKRRYALIQNNTGGTLYVAIGRAATASDLRVPPGGNFEPGRAPRGSINVFSTVGGDGVLIVD